MGYHRGGNVVRIHKTKQCFPAGLLLLYEEFNNIVGARTLHIETKIENKQYKIDFSSGKKSYYIPTHFIDNTGSYTKYKLAKDSHKFLKTLYENNDIMVFFNQLKNTYVKNIPVIVCRDDPIIPDGMLESQKYQEIVSHAKWRMELSTFLRGDNKVQDTNTLLLFLSKTGIRV